MSNCKQMGGSAAMGLDLARQMEGDKRESSEEEIENYNELHNELVRRYIFYYEESGLKYTDARDKAVDHVNKICRGKSEKDKIKILKKGIKLFTEPSIMKDLAWKAGLISGARKKKKSKGSKKKGHSRKGSKGKKKKKSKTPKKQGGGKSRKPKAKKAKETKIKKKSRSRRPRRMRTRGQKRAGAGDNPYPLMFNPYDTYGK